MEPSWRICIFCQLFNTYGIMLTVFAIGSCWYRGWEENTGRAAARARGSAGTGPEQALLFSIFVPDPGHKGTGSRIRNQEFKFSEYDTGCLSRNPDQDFFLSRIRIPNPELKKALDPGSGIRIRKTDPYQIHTYVVPYTPVACVRLREWNPLQKGETRTKASGLRRNPKLSLSGSVCMWADWNRGSGSSWFWSVIAYRYVLQWS